MCLSDRVLFPLKTQDLLNIRFALFLHQNYCRHRIRHRSFSMFSLFQRFSIRSLGRSASSVLCAVCGLIHIILVFILVPLFCFQRISPVFLFLPRCFFHLLNRMPTISKKEFTRFSCFNFFVDTN